MKRNVDLKRSFHEEEKPISREKCVLQEEVSV